jgi:hypothetical protein
MSDTVATRFSDEESWWTVVVGLGSRVERGSGAPAELVAFGVGQEPGRRRGPGPTSTRRIPNCSSRSGGDVFNILAEPAWPTAPAPAAGAHRLGLPEISSCRATSDTGW